MAVSDVELSAMAIEELDQACSLIWPELIKITPMDFLRETQAVARLACLPRHSPLPLGP